jgi:hypothetical protein
MPCFPSNSSKYFDFKLHFFAWWRHKGYRLQADSVRIIPELVEDRPANPSGAGSRLERP